MGGRTNSEIRAKNHLVLIHFRNYLKAWLKSTKSEISGKINFRII